MVCRAGASSSNASKVYLGGSVTKCSSAALRLFAAILAAPAPMADQASAVRSGRLHPLRDGAMAQRLRRSGERRATSRAPSGAVEDSERRRPPRGGDHRGGGPLLRQIGTGFTLLSKQANGPLDAAVPVAGRAPSSWKRAAPANMPDIAVGGPGFCFPVVQWNGISYADNRFEYERQTLQSRKLLAVAAPARSCRGRARRPCGRKTRAPPFQPL